MYIYSDVWYIMKLFYIQIVAQDHKHCGKPFPKSKSFTVWQHCHPQWSSQQPSLPALPLPSS